MKFLEQLDEIRSKSQGFSQSNISLSQKVYSDLVLAKKWKNVDFTPVKELDTCVFIAKDPEPVDITVNNRLIILPILQDNKEEQLSIKRITQIFKILNNATDTQVEKFTLAIYSSDATIVYYHISKGLVKPTQRNK